MSKDSDSIMADKCREGEEKEKVMYYSEECQNQNDPYRDTNEWEVPKGKGGKIAKHSFKNAEKCNRKRLHSAIYCQVCFPHCNINGFQ